MASGARFMTRQNASEQLANLGFREALAEPIFQPFRLRATRQ